MDWKKSYGTLYEILKSNYSNTLLFLFLKVLVRLQQNIIQSTRERVHTLFFFFGSLADINNKINLKLKD